MITPQAALDNRPLIVLLENFPRARTFNYFFNIVSVKFLKIRLLLPDVIVKKGDFTFASENTHPYSSARDCVSASCHASRRKGRFNVDLTGTSFHLPQVIPYGFNAYPACTKKVYAASMSEDHLRWSGKCGGYCGACSAKILYLIVNGC